MYNVYTKLKTGNKALPGALDRGNAKNKDPPSAYAQAVFLLYGQPLVVWAWSQRARVSSEYVKQSELLGKWHLRSIEPEAPGLTGQHHVFAVPYNKRR